MTELMEIIVTHHRVGFNDPNMAIHRHQQLYTTDGKLVVELCDFDECETLEPPEGFIKQDRPDYP